MTAARQERKSRPLTRAFLWAAVMVLAASPWGRPMAATAGKVCIAEVEELVELGELDPDGIHTPGIFVHRVVVAKREKRIEQRTVRK